MEILRAILKGFVVGNFSILLPRFRTALYARNGDLGNVVMKRFALTVRN